MDPVTIAGRFLLKKAAKEAIYQLAHGMSTKEYFKLRLQLVVDLFEKDKSVTPELLDMIRGASGSESLERIADDAGKTSLLDDVLSRRNAANDLFNSNTFAFLQDYEYNTEELGRSLSRSEIEDFVGKAKTLLRSLR